MGKSALIVDGGSFMYRAAYAMGTERNGVVKGILTYLSGVMEKYSFDDVAVCWDKGGSRWRKGIYPRYKESRKEKKAQLDLDAVYRQADLTEMYLRYLGVRQFGVVGVEADDLISWLAEYYSSLETYEKVVISTTDKDLWQLLDDKVVIYDHIRQLTIDKKVAEERLGLDLDLLADFKSLVGDPSDDIDGIKGIGEKTAVELIKEYGCLGDILDPKNSKALSKKKRTLRILNDSDSAELAYRLVRLPRLREAKWYLNSVECDTLVSKMFEEPTYSHLEVQMMLDRMELGRDFRGMVSSLEREDLSGMAAFFETEPKPEYDSLGDVDLAIRSCQKCELRSHCGEYGPTLPEGYNDVDIMVIGRNPGRDELEGGRPFIGRAGQRLDKLLEEVGLTRRDCWITNVNKCYSSNNRPPTYGEIQACSSYLRAEIDLIKPKFIMVFGNEAMSMVTPYGCSGITKHCGEILEHPKGILGDIDAWVAVCVHPSMALRSKGGELHMEYAAKQVKQFLEARAK